MYIIYVYVFICMYVWITISLTWNQAEKMDRSPMDFGPARGTCELQYSPAFLYQPWTMGNWVSSPIGLPFYSKIAQISCSSQKIYGIGDLFPISLQARKCWKFVERPRKLDENGSSLPLMKHLPTAPHSRAHAVFKGSCHEYPEVEGIQED